MLLLWFHNIQPLDSSCREDLPLVQEKGDLALVQEEYLLLAQEDDLPLVEEEELLLVQEGEILFL